jgi:hypothetical protein
LNLIDATGGYRRAIGAQPQNERRQELYRAYLNESRSSRLTGRIGQRLDGLRAIRNVLDAVPRDQLSEEQVRELRDELAACLARPDLHLVEQGPIPKCSISQGYRLAVDVDDRTGLYAVGDVSGPTVIRRPGDASFRAELHAPPGRWGASAHALARGGAGSACTPWVARTATG